MTLPTAPTVLPFLTTGSRETISCSSPTFIISLSSGIPVWATMCSLLFFNISVTCFPTRSCMVIFKKSAITWLTRDTMPSLSTTTIPSLMIFKTVSRVRFSSFTISSSRATFSNSVRSCKTMTAPSITPVPVMGIILTMVAVLPRLYL